MTETTNLVALRARRQRAIALISERYAEGLLDDDEVEAIQGRAAWCVKERRFPTDPTGRRYPWPLV